MSSEIDYADNEVKGLARFTPPTKLSKWLLGLFAPAGWGAFQMAYSNPKLFFLDSLSNEHLHTASIAIGLAISLAILFAMLMDVSLFIYHNKHRRFTYWVDENPLASISALVRNARYWHWLILASICTVCFALGYYVGKT